jgi:hypothetical protein
MGRNAGDQKGGESETKANTIAIKRELAMGKQ